jgi:hypothetical protein
MQAKCTQIKMENMRMTFSQKTFSGTLTVSLLDTCLRKKPNQKNRSSINTTPISVKFNRTSQRRCLSSGNPRTSSSFLILGKPLWTFTRNQFKKRGPKYLDSRQVLAKPTHMTPIKLICRSHTTRTCFHLVAKVILELASLLLLDRQRKIEKLRAVLMFKISVLFLSIIN